MILSNKGNSKFWNLQKFDLFIQMSQTVTNCDSCSCNDSCYQICCRGIFLCRSCVLDDSIINEHYVCPICGRELSGAYRILLNMAQYNQNSYIKPNFGTQNYSIIPKNNFRSNKMRPYDQSHYSNQDQGQDFKFTKNLSNSTHTRNNSFSSIRNSFNFEFNNVQSQSHHNCESDNNFVFEKQHQPRFLNENQTNQLFSNNARNKQNYGHNQHQFKNKNCNNPNNYGPQNNCFGQNQPNYGYFHSNNQLERVQCKQPNYQNYQSGNGFKQNIRQRRPQNNFNFQFSQNDKMNQQNTFTFAKQQNSVSTFQQRQKDGNNFQFDNSQRRNPLQQQSCNNYQDINRSNNFNFNSRNNFNFNSNANKFSQVNQCNPSNISNYNGNSLSQQNNERLSKSAVKMRRVSPNPENGYKNTFMIDLQGKEHNKSEQNIIVQEKLGANEKDLSPTFGFEDLPSEQFDGLSRNNSQMLRMQQEQQIATRLKRSNSEYTLGSRSRN